MATRTNLTLLTIAVMLFFASCNQPAATETADTGAEETTTEETTETMAATSMWDATFAASMVADEPGTPLSAPEGATTYAVDAGNSKMYWRGTKPTGTHDGTINVSGGQFMVADGNVVGGMVEIDMTSIANVDLAADEEKKAQLEGHLKSPDFFNVAEHPKAMLEVTKLEAGEGENNYNVSGNLTIKGITHEVTFPAMMMMEEGKMMAKASFKLDRSKWNVTFGSKSFPELLGDVVVSDDMDIVLDLQAMTATEQGLAKRFVKNLLCQSNIGGFSMSLNYLCATEKYRACTHDHWLRFLLSFSTLCA